MGSFEKCQLADSESKAALCFSALKDAPVGGSSAVAQDVSGGDQREEESRESRKAFQVPLELPSLRGGRKPGQKHAPLGIILSFL